MTEAKRLLRAQIQARFPGQAERRQASQRICRHILSAELWHEAATVAAYMALPREADLTAVIGEAWRTGRTLLLPRVDGSRMSFHAVRSEAELSPGAYGILAPSAACPEVSPGRIDLLLTPLEALDRQGNRLGKGGGYYDRLLSAFPDLTTLACVLPWQWAAAVPVGPADRPVSGAVDPDGFTWFE